MLIISTGKVGLRRKFRINRIPVSYTHLDVYKRQEEDNVAPLVAEILAALRGRIDFEIVYVDDTSRDATLQRLRDLQTNTPELRVIRHLANAGQSTAVRTGVKAARAAWIATLDGDGQNDTAAIPNLLDQRASAAADVNLFAGWRVNRPDSGSKRWASTWRCV